MQKDVCVFEISNHLVWVGDEVWRQVAAVELHAFNDFEFGFSGLGFFNRDHAFVADFLHRFSDHLADFGFAVSGDGANLSNFFRSVDLLGLAEKVCNNFSHSQVDTALQVHRVHAGSNSFCAFLNDSLTENGRSGRAVTSSVVGLGSNFAQHLCAHVFELVFEFDFLGDRYAVLGDARSAKDLSITTLRPFGPSVTLTASARISTPRSIFSRAVRPNFTSFAAILLSGKCPGQIMVN